MFKRTRKLAAAGILSITPLMALALPGIAHAASGTTYEWTGAASSTAATSPSTCTTNCWSVAGNWSVSTDGVTYVAATTAPSSSDNGGAGDNLVFDNSLLSSANATLNNDISGLTVGNVSTVNTNSGNYAYSIAGQAITVTGGVAGGTIPQVTANIGVTFSGDQTYGTTANSAALKLNSSVTIASGTLTANANFAGYNVPVSIASGATLKIANNGSASSLAGAGTIVLLSPQTGSNYPNFFSLNDAGTASTFSGSFDIQKGGQLGTGGDNPANPLGTAGITVESGGQLSLQVQPNTPSESGTLNIPNALTLAGNGAGVDQMDQGAIESGFYDSSKNETAGTLAVNLTGSVTLTGDTNLSSTYATAATYNFTGTLNHNGHVLGAVTAAQPTYGVSTVQVNGATVAGGANNVTPSAPKTPNTGFALAASHPTQTLAVTVLGAALIAGAAFKMRRATAAVRR